MKYNDKQSSKSESANEDSDSLIIIEDELNKSDTTQLRGNAKEDLQQTSHPDTSKCYYITDENETIIGYTSIKLSSQEPNKSDSKQSVENSEDDLQASHQFSSKLYYNSDDDETVEDPSQKISGKDNFI